jgi:predicted TIM-barrel fold metal-dependent hydrolase
VAFISLTQQIGRVAFARISEDEKRQVLGLNARRVLGVA